MEAALFVYFAGVVGSLAKFFGISGFLMIVATLSITAIRFGMWTDRGCKKEDRPTLKMAYWIATLGLLFCLIANLLPDQKTAYLAGGVYLGQKAITSETAEKVVTIVNQKLDSYIQEAEKSVVKKVKE